MDSFFAAVEERDEPKYKNKPLAVGSDEKNRGVISTANYVARKFGVCSAISSAKAKLLCPDLILVPVNMEKYRSVSASIRSIFKEYTELVEPLSLDEAFLDVSDCKNCYNSATWIAKEIRDKIFQKESLTASAGVSVNKFIAKVASDWHKPNGQKVVPPEEVDEFIKSLPVNKIFGVGPKTAEKLYELKVKTCGQLQTLSELELIDSFGVKFGKRLFLLARGIDNRQVEPNKIRKSLSVEETFTKDLSGLLECKEKMNHLLLELKKRLKRENKKYNKVFVKVKFADFSHTTVERAGEDVAIESIQQLLEEGVSRGNDKQVRLLGLGVRFVKESLQMSFMD